MLTGMFRGGPLGYNNWHKHWKRQVSKNTLIAAFCTFCGNRSAVRIICCLLCQTAPFTQTTGVLEQSANLTGNTNATITWRYRAPPAIDVFIRPYGGCSDDTNTCQELAGRCSGNSTTFTAVVRPPEK